MNAEKNIEIVFTDENYPAKLAGPNEYMETGTGGWRDIGIIVFCVLVSRLVLAMMFPLGFIAAISFGVKIEVYNPLCAFIGAVIVVATGSVYLVMRLFLKCLLN